MHRVWLVFSAGALGVALLVWSLILFPVFRWRHKSDQPPKQLPRGVKQNTPLELTWTIIPIAVVAMLFWLTMNAEGVTDNIAPHPFATVNVTGFRWSWRFDYPGTQISIVGTPNHAPQMILPLREQVHLNVRSADVAHSFWVPYFLFKRDAIPGVLNQFDWEPTQVGVYRGECGEFCGLDHALMTFTVRVVPVSQYQAWLSSGGKSL